MTGWHFPQEAHDLLAEFPRIVRVEVPRDGGAADAGRVTPSG